MGSCLRDADADVATVARVTVRKTVAGRLLLRRRGRCNSVAGEVGDPGEGPAGGGPFRRVASQVCHARIDRQADDDEQHNSGEGEDGHRLAATSATTAPSD